MAIALLALAVGVVLLLLLLVVARRHLPGQRDRRTALNADSGATFTYLGSEASHCDAGSDGGGGGCDGGGAAIEPT